MTYYHVPEDLMIITTQALWDYRDDLLQHLDDMGRCNTSTTDAAHRLSYYIRIVKETTEQLEHLPPQHS